MLADIREAALATGERTPERSLKWTPVRVAMLVATLLVILNLIGIPYYASPLAERVRSPLHATLKPSGLAGQALGIAAFTGFLFLWMYPLRKRLKILARSGALSRWLDVHIAVGLILPMLAATHAAWRFTGLIGLGFGAMFVVWMSGIVGRYLYVRIPPTRSGLAASLDDLRADRLRLLHVLTARSHLPLTRVEQALSLAPLRRQRPGIVGTFLQLLSDDLQRRRSVSALRRELERASASGGTTDRAALKEIVALTRRQIAFEQQIRMMDATQRIFRLWHAAHLPVAITALLAVLTHVGVAVITGMTWFW